MMETRKDKMIFGPALRCRRSLVMSWEDRYIHKDAAIPIGEEDKWIIISMAPYITRDQW
ncbi:uncharacterized protein AFUA_3G01730 [Aspergillus fumigatus Af293]|uniref:Uncharacterized protein n=2 Tax=Aspergillus fumigatus TaxID=746128 RepID=Q4WFM1_ASPFU|nr:hypothetical protein AFUA_3G01730 [Aspergillus fumigatus Af293]EAL86456.1 hypothetical protein AFUA_3G01730 [Aspergillus fumigatus Af293]EDP53488.1 hypothetical protein AFUB_046670 [Aspergillus fumigatus A1163]